MLFSSSLKGIDHLLIGVQQLEEARHHYLRLGFRLTPRGRHIGWGTANYCIMFPDDYLELIGIVDKNQDTNGLDVFLENGEGGLGLAFRSEDIGQTAACLKEAGVPIDGPKDLKRILELEHGDVMPAFELLRYDNQVSPKISSFVCDHKTPDVVWQSQWLAHANGARGIKRVVYVTPNPSDVITKYSEFFGADTVVVTDGCIDVYVSERKQVLRFIAPEDISRFYPGVEPNDGAAVDYMIAFHLWVEDLKVTQAYFDQYRVSYQREGDSRVRLQKNDSCGVVLAFDAL
ncbi:VOC family protein [uncultured Kiloniella sp.]|uniref:VOC family protein n=1 Tax=uncultured Kiloniella sp. TaxID=1133091 RepID=UPI002634C0F0|nr:VOC family protein [uncultured Kiloniella sp.]